MLPGRRLVARAAALVATAAVVAACGGRSEAGPPDVAAGVRPRATTSTIHVAVPSTAGPTTSRRGAAFRGLIDPSGRPPGGALVFRSAVAVPDDLVFVLAVGSDARPREDVRRAHADSVHLLAVDPRTMRGTIVGFPRDAWVEVPGRGNRKLTDVLPAGGPELLARTVEHLTGLPVDAWFLTGFAGIQRMVDALGGVDVHVERRMNDGYSGARFKPGWHHMNGEMVLGYSRNRHDVPDGDFGRSRNQGRVMLAGLAKLRAEVADEAGLGVWQRVLTEHSFLAAGPTGLKRLAVLARGLDPAGIANVVVPGRVGTAAGRQSVVYLDERAAAMFLDLRADAVIDGGGARPSPSTTASTSAPTTTQPSSRAPLVTTGPTTTTSTTSTTTSTTTWTTTPPSSTTAARRR